MDYVASCAMSNPPSRPRAEVVGSFKAGEVYSSEAGGLVLYQKKIKKLSYAHAWSLS